MVWMKKESQTERDTNTCKGAITTGNKERKNKAEKKRMQSSKHTLMLRLCFSSFFSAVHFLSWLVLSPSQECECVWARVCV